MRPTRWLVSSAVVAALALSLFATGALSGHETQAPAPTARSVSSRPVDGVSARIVTAQRRLADQPHDARTWAALALDYLDQAKATADPSWFRKADGATATALALDPDRNDLAYAARAALDAGRHSFHAALTAARHGLRINPYSATLYGTLADALTQLGRYDEAARAVQRMNDLRPGVPAFTRASYVYELRGDITGAGQALQRASQVATTPAEQAFAQLYLGELAFNYRADPHAALAHYERGLRAAPDDHALQAARAKALAALGRGTEAVTAYRHVVDAAPLPQYVLELAELLQARHDPSASQQFKVFEAALALYQANRVTVDVEATLYAADHQAPARALAAAALGWRTRPFVEMADAYAWALYRNHRYAAALSWSDRALVHGWSSPLALYHRGLIQSRLADRAAAIASLRRCLRLSPSFDPLRAPLARAELQRLLRGSASRR